MEEALQAPPGTGLFPDFTYTVVRSAGKPPQARHREAGNAATARTICAQLYSPGSGRYQTNPLGEQALNLRKKGRGRATCAEVEATSFILSEQPRWSGRGCEVSPLPSLPSVSGQLGGRGRQLRSWGR